MLEWGGESGLAGCSRLGAFGYCRGGGGAEAAGAPSGRDREGWWDPWAEAHGFVPLPLQGISALGIWYWI